MVRITKRRKINKKRFLLPLIGVVVVFVAAYPLIVILRLTTSSVFGSGSSSAYPTNPPGTCISTYSGLPELWRPAKQTTKKLRLQDSPWTREDQALAEEAGSKGVQELVDFYSEASDEDILGLNTDAVNSLIDCVYAPSPNVDPGKHEIVVKAAIRVLKVSTRKYVSDHVQKWHTECDKMYEKMKYLGYAHYLLMQDPTDRELEQVRDTLADRLNTSFRSCGTISALMDEDVDKTLAIPDQDHDSVMWEWCLHAIALIDVMIVPGIQAPEGTEKFIADVWNYFGRYKYKNARDFPGGKYTTSDLTMAYFVTHAAYVPTGYGRHIQLIEDAPWLYTYIRENFYAALETKSPDLIAEFVDLTRQYGCDEQSDIQVRDGARFLLKLYKENKTDWARGPREDQHGRKGGSPVGGRVQDIVRIFCVRMYGAVGFV
jgi:hypothetical protein